ncbi:hypothetical protein K461DRAFT_174000 [Myriangium duriaei CBS 260.36]|uniref:Rhodopsin domain-containing protein n=1 Tax=Myriangium duriaei CBS 260.36 TaxID=1168546 RepID=A0A9P4J321_9PEZI|nr:hypothetical protein K461DRAFT_174000 [Myriangium duriaei CBS 260.36]
MALSIRSESPITGSALVPFVATWIMGGVAILLLLLRVYAGVRRISQLRYDFYLTAVGVTSALTTQILLGVCDAQGVGKHVADVTYPQLFAGLKYNWIGIFIGIVAVIFAKLAIVALLYQITTIVQTERKIFLLVMAGMTVIMNVLQIAISISQCVPYDYLWNRGIPGGSCPRLWLAQDFAYAHAAISAFFDLALAIYPITLVWKLQLDLGPKIGFCALMAGGVACAVGPIVRAVYLLSLDHPDDITYQLPFFQVWGLVEVWVVLIIASVPPLRPLFKRGIEETKNAVASRRVGASTKNTVVLVSRNFDKMTGFDKTETVVGLDEADRSGSYNRHVEDFA